MRALRPVGVGVVGAGAVSQVLESRLFGISPFDPIAYVGAAIVLLTVGGAATLLPTREALKVDPMTALRHD